MTLPRYADLARPDDTGLPLAWGHWGPDDQVGTLNNITPETVARAAGLIREGRRFNLNLPVDVPFGLMSPGTHHTRTGPALTLFKFDGAERLGRDDKLDAFFLQGSTQWDGLTHIGDPRHGFYNHARADQVRHGAGSRNGIDKVTEFGLAGRGVVVDLVRHFARIGRPWHPFGQDVASAADVAACLAHQGVALEPGDILLVRTGWLDVFFKARTAAEREALFKPLQYSGLSGEEDMWEFLWDHRVAAAASDSATLELFPLQAGRPSLHLAIARLGLNIGEFFDLTALCDACAADGRWTVFLTSCPLYVIGGVGSPANAIAIK